MTETGLYLGKFAPFHNGHQYVVETALSEVDELYMLIYDEPEVIDIPVPVRSGWIHKLYPEVTVLQAWGGPEESGHTPEIQRAHEEYIDGLLPDDLSIDRFYSSEFYGGHMSEFLGAMDRRIDPDREAVPISGTKIRRDPYANRDFVSDIVYEDLVTNVAIVGGPSTGKTTLSRALADEFDTEFMHEYGREYWEEHAIDRRLTTDQLADIADGHLEEETKRLLESDTYLFTDTNAITTAVFCQYYHGHIPERLMNHAKNCRDRYDVTIVCDTDIPYADTEDRSGEGNRQRLQKHTIAMLETYRIPYYIVSGDVRERVSQVSAILDKENVWEWERQLD